MSVLNEEIRLLADWRFNNPRGHPHLVRIQEFTAVAVSAIEIAERRTSSFAYLEGRGVPFALSITKQDFLQNRVVKAGLRTTCPNTGYHRTARSRVDSLINHAGTGDRAVVPFHGTRV